MKLFSLVLASAVAAAGFAAVPSFSPDWTAVVSDHTVINQGGTQNPDGSVTCGATAPQCKVQTIFQASRQFFSVTQQKQKLAGPDGSGVVVDFKASKEYQVDSAGNCQAYCPLPKSQQGALTPIGIPVNATNLGSQTSSKYCNGESNCVLFQFNQTIFGAVVMETDNFYLKMVNETDAEPLSFVTLLTPFGVPAGNEEQQFYQFTAGAIPESTFAVKNATGCPLGNQCPQDDDHQHTDDNPQPPAQLSMRQLLSASSPLAKEAAQRMTAARAERPVLKPEQAAAMSKWLSSFPEDHPLQAMQL